MASIKTRRRADGSPIYQVVWRETPGGRQTSKNFDRKRAAERFKIEHQVHRPLRRPVPRSGHTRRPLGGLHDPPAVVDKHRGALRGFGQTIASHRRPAPARRDPGCRGRQSSRRTELPVFTGNHLRAVLMAARDEGRIVRVPRPQLPKVRGKVTVPTEDEIDTPLAAANPQMAIAIELAARAGPRRSEALGLTVDRIDRDRCTITVDRQARPRLAAREPFRFAPRLKTDNSHRVVPVTAATIAALPAVSDDPEHNIVLTSNGRPWAGIAFGTAWNRLAHRVGLPYTFHDLRHYFCTSLLSQGINSKAVAKAAGMDAVTLLST